MQIQAGNLLIGSELFSVPDIEFQTKLGEGANAIVFSALDVQLSRQVAVKVWKQKGIYRSQFEAAKIAQLAHPRFVTTHRFGYVGEQPFAVMELIQGKTVKEWLMTDPPVDARLAAWKSFAGGMSALYALNELHGDPHTGNLLIYKDRYTGSLDLKIADLGTSYFWSESSGFEKREVRLLKETAHRLLLKEDPSTLVEIAESSHPVRALEVLNAVWQFLDTVNGLPVHEARGLVAGRIVEMVLQTPVFRLENMLEYPQLENVTTRERVVRRLNAKLLAIWNITDAEDQFITDEALRNYRALRDAFVLSG